ncbi:zinc finger protein 239-like [Malaya genurostris]|uniref:zinc finger protein 239-like n=1 Tax=Malaya genurostris TaxID=325434 RepID=UPI0026F3F7D0|nr:zinc finger protein 239-like [Malaya genurostris]
MDSAESYLGEPSCFTMNEDVKYENDSIVGPLEDKILVHAQLFQQRLELEQQEPNPEQTFNIQSGLEPRSKYKTPFHCEICNKKFRKSTCFWEHQLIHSGEHPYKCEICDKGFLRKGDVFYHKRIHTGEKPHKCDICGKSFSKVCNLNTHRRVHTGVKPFKCDICGKSFSQSGTLSIHERTHTGERPFECSICGKDFISGNNWRAHLNTHTNEELVNSEIFHEKSFVDRILKKRLDPASQERLYPCDICGRTFLRACQLACHRRIHTGERPYQCTYCEKRFIDASGLAKHKRIHTGERPYQCGDCSYAFTTSTNLATHIRRAHSSSKAEKATTSTTDPSNDLYPDNLPITKIEPLNLTETELI